MNSLKEILASLNGSFLTIILVILVSASGYVWGWTKTKTISQLQQKLIESELGKFKPITDKIVDLDNANTITLDDIERRKSELEKIENALKDRPNNGMSLEDALNVIKQ